jgi:uncharacterized membrane-anchored protein
MKGEGFASPLSKGEMTMAEGQTVKYPAYVTDGFHTYPWNDALSILLDQGKLKEAPAPAPKKEKLLSARARTKLEEQRKQALKDAERAVELFKAPIAPAKLEDVFGSPPRDE